MQAQSFRTLSYSETYINGGGFAFAFNARTANDTPSEFSARFDYVVPNEASIESIPNDMRSA